MDKTYDVKTRGAEAPNYSQAENKYRNNILSNLQLAFITREQPLMELNDMPYSQYYLINRQSDLAYNPPKNNPNDTRIVTGIVHEKDNTIESLIKSMNLQPKVKLHDENDLYLEDFSIMLTAMLKKSLNNENFKDKIGDYARVNISQGNVFVLDQKEKEYDVIKTVTGISSDAKITSTIKEVGEKCEFQLIPNTAVYFPNLLEKDLNKQPYHYVVLHLPKSAVHNQFRDFKRWNNVPVYPTKTVPNNVTGNWGDFYLQQPQKDYVEVIMYVSEIDNDYQVLVNGVMMYPVGSDENNNPIGYPLTEISPSGKSPLVKGDSEAIPFFAYGKSIPMKNEVKEQVANELLRIMVHKMRYSSFPTLGNNSDKVLTADIWTPATVIPDLQRKDLEVLFPEMRVNQADFSFYQMVMQSIDETSVSKSVEGTNSADITATQYVDQKRENLKKLGIVLDGVMQFLRDLYERRLEYIIEDLDKKSKKYSMEEGKEMEMYESFVSEENVDDGTTEYQFNFTDDITATPEEIFEKEFNAKKPTRIMHVNPKNVKDIIKKMKSKMKVEVVSEPEG